MAATVTLDKVLKLAAKLTADEYDKLVAAVKSEQRKRATWLRKLDSQIVVARKLSKAGQLNSFRTADEMMAHLDKINGMTE